MRGGRVRVQDQGPDKGRGAHQKVRARVQDHAEKVAETVTVDSAEYLRLRCHEVFWRTAARKYAAEVENLKKHGLARSLCAFCELRAPDDKRCPMNKIPRQYDIVVWVDECDQWRPRPSERK